VCYHPELGGSWGKKEPARLSKGIIWSGLRILLIVGASASDGGRSIGRRRATSERSDAGVAIMPYL